MELYLFRHGQTDWNLERRFQGSTNIPLNQTGRLQAADLKPKIAALDLEHVFSSDLDRAKETAGIVYDGSISYHSELQEAHLGDAQRKLVSEIETSLGEDVMEKWFSLELMDFAFPGGETKSQHMHRLKSFIEDQWEKWQGKRVGISTHGGALRRLIQVCDNSPQVSMKIKNCALFKLELLEKKWIYHGPL